MAWVTLFLWNMTRVTNYCFLTLSWWLICSGVLSAKTGSRHWISPALNKVSSSYIADDLRSREDDVIWRVRWGQDWLYVYLLLEFQSTVDRFMAVRILSYVGLLYQDLIRSGQLTASGQLPPVLPLVLYNSGYTAGATGVD
jgi:Putative transposase, YhgA-like